MMVQIAPPAPRWLVDPDDPRAPPEETRLRADEARLRAEAESAPRRSPGRERATEGRAPRQVAHAAPPAKSPLRPPEIRYCAAAMTIGNTSSSPVMARKNGAGCPTATIEMMRARPP